MNKTTKWLTIAVALVLLIAVAAVLYSGLSKKYMGNNIAAADGAENSEDAGDGADANKAPDFTVTDASGNEVRLSDFRGKPVVLNFWATWCDYCTWEMPYFDDAAAENPDVQFLMVNVTDGLRETVRKASKYIEEEGYEFDVFYDTQRDAVGAYYVNSYPATFFIDEEGDLVAYHRGMLNREMLDQGIAMLTEKDKTQ